MVALSSAPTLPPTLTALQLHRAGLLEAGPGCQISPHAVFVPADVLGTQRSIVLGERCVIGPFAVLHGAVRLGDRVRVEEHVVVGKPEHGYAVREVYAGAGAPTVVDDEVVLRSGAIVYADVRIGAGTVIGHHTLLRTAVAVGTDSQLGHHLTVERQTHIGQRVRMSPSSHITAATHVADRVFLGAGVRTVNDKQLIWRDPDQESKLAPPRFEEGCKVGSGSSVMAGVVIGEHALVGMGSVVTRDVPAYATAYGNPARVHATGGRP
jgi:acetyltransferase-like isoleucine patch superfamily enzyme